MPRKGGKRKKARTHVNGGPDGATQVDNIGKEKAEVPQTIVAKTGKVVPAVAELIQDLRKLMNPYTASNLKEKNDNKMKDYIAVASQLGVSHLMVLSQTKSNDENNPHHNVVMKLGRVPSGPTLHFHITKYTLCRHIHASQKHPYESASMYLTPPLVVFNNFGATEQSAEDILQNAEIASTADHHSNSAQQQHIQIIKLTLKHLFPSIDVTTIQLSQCRRVVLIDYNKESGEVDIRHYAIKAQPSGISRNVKKLMTQSNNMVPNLGSLADVSEFLSGGSTSGAYGYPESDSEAEDESTKVVLPDRYVGKGAAKSQQCAMKLVEIGPRMSLDIFKVQRGLCEDDILYHKYESRTPEEAIANKLRISAAKKLKEERRLQQEANVQKKKDAADEKARLKEEKYKKRGREEMESEEDSEQSEEESVGVYESEQDEDDEVEEGSDDDDDQDLEMDQDEDV